MCKSSKRISRGGCLPDTNIPLFPINKCVKKQTHQRFILKTPQTDKGDSLRWHFSNTLPPMTTWHHFTYVSLLETNLNNLENKLHDGPSNTNHLTKMDAPLILTLRPTFLLNTCTIILDSYPKLEISPHKLETQYLGTLLGPNSTPLHHILITESSSTNLFPKGSSHFTYWKINKWYTQIIVLSQSHIELNAILFWAWRFFIILWFLPSIQRWSVCKVYVYGVIVLR